MDNASDETKADYDDKMVELLPKYNVNGVSFPEAYDKLHPLEPIVRSWGIADPDQRPEVTNPEAAARVLQGAFDGLDQEACIMLCLDTKHRLIEAVLVSVGSVDHTFMAPREIFRSALLAGATAIIVAHNHPSGSSKPSPDDEAVTRRLVRAGETLGVSVLDHMVFGYGTATFTSLARTGTL